MPFFQLFDLPTGFERHPRDELDGPLQIVLKPRPSFNIEHVEGYPVIPRAETIEHMLEYWVSDEPALEMIADESDRDIDASHEDPRLDA